MLVDYWVIRRGALDVSSLYPPAATSVYAKFDSSGLISLAAGLVAGWAWQYGLVPVMQGPLATSLGNTDFSWLSGGVVAGALYFVLARRAVRA
jgi:cytosine/uracil/thiamine/allantoin permease